MTAACSCITIRGATQLGMFSRLSSLWKDGALLAKVASDNMERRMRLFLTCLLTAILSQLFPRQLLQLLYFDKLHKLQHPAPPAKPTEYATPAEAIWGAVLDRRIDMC